jgi:ppGpp synthetase/RelA/SpoT-type nucleotidyltranferase
MNSKPLTSDLGQDPWRDSPELIQKFLQQQSDYKQLCGEVAYILKKRLGSSDIEIADITWRAKTLKSFLEKIQRKKYESPFSQITDFAGVRVVCLYLQDINLIEEIIRKEFEILEKVDKLNDKGTDRFGYGAMHFVAKLGKGSLGARYDDLRELVCEIQVRTVLQDAWAIIDHHLIYKQEADVPPQVIRKLNSLAGLLETADDQFEQVRKERRVYVTNVRSQRNQPQKFLDNDLNLDSFREYLSWKFENVPLESFEGQIKKVFEAIDSNKYKKLFDLETIVNQTQGVREEANAALKNRRPGYVESAANLLGISLFLADEYFRQVLGLPSGWAGLFDEYVKRRA